MGSTPRNVDVSGYINKAHESFGDNLLKVLE